MQEYTLKDLQIPSFQRGVYASSPVMKGEYLESREGSITVWHYNGMRYILDGQHRVAAKIKAYGENAKIWGQSFYGTETEAANEFVRLNADRKGLTSIELFNARFAAGDPAALSVAAAAAKHGYAISAKRVSSATRLTGITTLLAHAELAERVLMLTSEAFPEQEPGARYLEGLVEYLRQAGDQNKLASTITDDYIIRTMRSRFRTQVDFMNILRQYIADNGGAERSCAVMVFRNKIGVKQRATARKR